MNSHDLGFLRIGAASPELIVADTGHNREKILGVLEEAKASGASGVLLPELCVTGYSCADLFYQRRLIDEAAAATIEIAAATRDLGLFAVVGLPVEVDNRLYNAAAFLADGAVVGLVPKINLPTTNEYYEERWFTSGADSGRPTVKFGGAEVPFGADLLFTHREWPQLKVGVEVCEDLWAAIPPSSSMALAGATLLLNPSASNELVGKVHYRRDLVKQQSGRCLAAYAYASAGACESTTDVLFSGHLMVAENGRILAEGERFGFENKLIVSDVDLDLLAHERLRNGTFSFGTPEIRFREISFATPLERAADPKDLRREVVPAPFVPEKRGDLDERTREVFRIQSHALARRLKHTGAKNVVIGISGGLDSTLALLVTVKAFDLLQLSRDGIEAITMPGFGTTERTRNNAGKLAEILGLDFRTISIDKAVRQHFKDIGHPEDKHDVTYENSQARERTQILMDIANQVGGFVVGTGDLSELALGWCTFNGDHMSMYHVNAGVPKTLVRHLVEWASRNEFTGDEAAVLLDICDTPITPELLPLDDEDALVQKTEETIGPFELHDFFLFHAIRHGFSPRKVAFLARVAFAGGHTDAEIDKWLKNFYRRFFAHQFKRSAMPDGPKVGTVALSPRGDWRMPSDASAAIWLEELENL